MNPWTTPSSLSLDSLLCLWWPNSREAHSSETGCMCGVHPSPASGLALVILVKQWKQGWSWLWGYEHQCFCWSKSRKSLMNGRTGHNWSVNDKFFSSFWILKEYAYTPANYLQASYSCLCIQTSKLYMRRYQYDAITWQGLETKIPQPQLMSVTQKCRTLWYNDCRVLYTCIPFQPITDVWLWWVQSNLFGYACNDDC